MADIKQAGKWIEEGKMVRRSTWIHQSRIGRQTGIMCSSLIGLFWIESSLHGPVQRSGEFILSVSDLSTEDWEIA